MASDPQIPAEATAAEDWHRVNPLTPVLDSFGIIVVIIVAGGYAAQNFIQQAISDLATGDSVDLSFAAWLGSHRLVVLAVIGGLLLIIALGALYSWLAWRVMGYRVDAEAIYARSGLLAKKMRKARLDRVQSIDLQQKLLPRLLGLAELVFDVAGGKGSNVSLKYLSRRKADACATNSSQPSGRSSREPAARLPVARPSRTASAGRHRNRRRRPSRSRPSTSPHPNAPVTASGCA